MILLINPRATRPSNRRFPLSLMALGAALPPEVTWAIVDGNRPGIDVAAEVATHVATQAAAGDPVRMIALTVMPGPQLANAVPLTKALRRAHPDVAIVWGGNFGSLYAQPVLDSPDIDWLVRGQGEKTLVELLEVLDGLRAPETVKGLCFRRPDGTHHLGAERIWVGPAELPDPPYDRIDVDDYLHPTFLGRRSGVYQASIGCPYACSFCGVISVYGRREKVQTAERVAEHLRYLVERHGMDSVHFYDNNFFLNEEHARGLAAALEPLGIRWWCEARVDALCRFSDDTWRRLKRAGLTMVFCGAESGSDEVLARMQKGITTAQVAEVAAKTREHGIIPEFSFVFGDPDDAAGEIDNTINFIRRLKGINPAMELITYFYTPTPQRGSTYGGVNPLTGTPTVLEEWTTPEWVDWMTHENPDTPWMDDALRARVEDFTTVLKSRFPSVQDKRTKPWGKALGRVLAGPRWSRAHYARPALLRTVRRWSQIVPDDRQLYGHLRPSAEAAE